MRVFGLCPQLSGEVKGRATAGAGEAPNSGPVKRACGARWTSTERFRGTKRCLRSAPRRVWSAAAVRRILAIVTPIAGLCALTWAQTFFSAAAVDTVTAGLGCGTGPNQVYKYVSVVTVPASVPAIGNEYIAGNATDCFANATFVNLCSYDTNQSSFDVTVYAFTADQWNQTPEQPDAGTSSDDASVDTGPDGGAGDASLDASDATADATTIDAGDAGSDAGTSQADGASDAQTGVPSTAVSGQTITNELTVANNAAISQLNAGACGNTVGKNFQLNADLAASAGWTLDCTATQQSDIPVLAQCTPRVQLR
jgi:hypothetical protein